MSNVVRSLTLVVLTAVVAAELGAGSHPSGPSTLPIANAQSPTAAPASGGPCAIEDATATTDRAAVPIGGTVRLTLSWRWRCTGGPTKRDVLVVADPTAPGASIDPDAQLFVANLRLAFGSFADRVGFADGQRFGTVLASCPATVSAPLATGQSAHVAWRDGLARIPVGPDRDMLGALALARGALASPPPTAGEPSPLVVVVDAGGPECPTRPQPSKDEYATACRRLRDAGATVALLTARSSGGRLSGCNSPGWAFRSSNVRGTDLPAILDVIADRAFAPDTPTEAFTRIALATGDWALLASEPVADATFPEVQWFERITRPDAGEIRVGLTARARSEAVTGPRRLAVEGTGGPSAGVTGVSGDLVEEAFEAPAVCIFARGRGMADCGVSEPIFAPVVVR